MSQPDVSGVASFVTKYLTLFPTSSAQIPPTGMFRDDSLYLSLSGCTASGRAVKDQVHEESGYHEIVSENCARAAVPAVSLIQQKRVQKQSPTCNDYFLSVACSTILQVTGQKLLSSFHPTPGTVMTKEEVQNKGKDCLILWRVEQNDLQNPSPSQSKKQRNVHVVALAYSPGFTWCCKLSKKTGTCIFLCPSLSTQLCALGRRWDRLRALGNCIGLSHLGFVRLPHQKNRV